ncbi:hypothetical protein PIB30_109885, partial [Stylosanthes scabra]|nr:hypothetical protein [Stylosanthes scabra]
MNHDFPIDFGRRASDYCDLILEQEAEAESASYKPNNCPINVSAPHLKQFRYCAYGFISQIRGTHKQDYLKFEGSEVDWDEEKRICSKYGVS